jgi:hypothetical protein
MLDESHLHSLVQSVPDRDACIRRIVAARALLNGRVTLDEYRDAKRRMKSDKAVGIDGVPFELFRGTFDDAPGVRKLISELDDLLVHVFNVILDSGKYPDAWRLAVLVPLLKGGDLDSSLPTNYRGIALLSALSKLFANILEHRLSRFQHETGLISTSQFGFTKDRRTLDPVFILDTLIDKAQADEAELYVTFIDFQKAYDFVPLDALFYKMLRGNMIGPVYKIIHSMYECVSSMVRKGSEFSDVIHQHVGLRQGCILSPCLFSFFIADFPKFLETAECSGIQMHNTCVRCLFYADDGALLARTPEDMQHMLNALHQYCALWRMFVNTTKTKVMVFNRARVSAGSALRHAPVFTYNGVPLEVVHEFKYLGVMFSSRRTKYNVCIEHRLAQSKRLVAAWMRRCHVWSFKPDTVISQFKTCIMPALEYGVGLWGVGMYNSAAWSKIEVFWRSIARCILGVSMRTPNSAVYGDLGWHPFWTRAAWQATAMWTRITEMPSGSLTREAMCVQRDMYAHGKDCWLTKFHDTLCGTSFVHDNGDANVCVIGRDKWDLWFRTPDFSLQCSRLHVDEGDRIRTIRWETDCLSEFHSRAVSTWKKDMLRERAKRGDGGNKLRTYALFKTELGFEPYLVHIDNRDMRVLLSKFRFGICPLRIETGRYEVVNREKKSIPVEQRTCRCCLSSVVEDEYHFLLQCSAFSHRRQRMFSIVKDILALSDSELHRGCLVRDNVFARFMSSTDKTVVCAIARYIWDAFKIREQVLSRVP